MKQKELCLNFQEQMRNAADPVRAEKQQRYMKSSMPFYGVPMPEVRKICCVLFKAYVPASNDEYRVITRELFDTATHREQWYAALFYAENKKYIKPENIDIYLHLIRESRWWDLVDGVAASLVGGALRMHEERPRLLKEWIRDENMWVRRTALLAQLKYKEYTDFELLKELIISVAHEKVFFIRKVIGWVLREYSKTDPIMVKRFIADNRKQLSALSIKEGLKAIQRKRL